MMKIKKAAFAVVVAGLAFGFSAFTTIKKSSVFVYYKTNMTLYPGATDHRGYQYYADDRCETGGTLCSAEWDIGSNPIPSDGDALPSNAFFQSGTITAGRFQ